MQLSTPAVSPLRRFEGLVARAQENMFLNQTLLRDIRAQIVKHRSEVSKNQTALHRSGTWAQIFGHTVGIVAGFAIKKPDLYSTVTKTGDLYKALRYDAYSYDNQTKLDELQQQLAEIDMIHQANVSFLQSLENHKNQIDQRKQSMFH
jgi:hypothetical protein